MRMRVLSVFSLSMFAVLSLANASETPKAPVQPPPAATTQPARTTTYRVIQMPRQPAPAQGAVAAGTDAPQPSSSQSPLNSTYALGMDLGTGYDPRTLNIKAQCMTFQTKLQPAPSEAANTANVVKSQEDIQNDIAVSYGESMGLGAFKDSATFQFANSMDYESSAVTVVAHTRVTSPTMNTVDRSTISLVVDGTDYGAMMATDYNRFRNTCGDYYVSGVVTGGDYAGVLSIKKNLFKTSTTGALQLAQSASTALASESMSGSLQDSLTTMQQSGTVQVSEMWRGGPNNLNLVKPAITVQDLFSNYANSIAALQTTTNPISVQLSPYAWLTAANIPDQSGDYAAVESLAALYIQYSSVLEDMTYLKAHLGEYASPPDAATVQSWINAIETNIGTANTQITNCGKPALPCSGTLANAITPDQYEDMIPVYMGLPQTCLHISVNNPNAASGLYTLYLNGDPGQPMALYCQLGLDPQAYVPLVYVGSSQPIPWDQWPSSSGQQYNYSQQYYTHMLATLYNKVAIDETTLRLNPHDTTFATTYGAPEGGNSYVAYGTAAECLQWQQIGNSNIDLRGTPFAIDTSKTVWQATGYEINTNQCCPGVAAFDDTSGAKVKTVTIASNSGRCGAMMPWAAADNAHNIYVKWVGMAF